MFWFWIWNCMATGQSNRDWRLTCREKIPGIWSCLCYLLTTACLSSLHDSAFCHSPVLRKGLCLAFILSVPVVECEVSFFIFASLPSVTSGYVLLDLATCPQIWEEQSDLENQPLRLDFSWRWPIFRELKHFWGCSTLSSILSMKEWFSLNNTCTFLKVWKLIFYLVPLQEPSGECFYVNHS